MSIRLIVIREDPRASAILADVARRLGVPGLVPDQQSDVFIELADRGGDDAWRRVRDALDAAGDDWWEYLHLPSHAAGTAAS